MKIEMSVPSKTWYDKRINVEEWLAENIGQMLECHQANRVLSDRDIELGVQKRREEALMRFAALTGNTTPYDYVRITTGDEWHAISHYNYKDTHVNLVVDLVDETTAVMFKLKFA